MLPCDRLFSLSLRSSAVLLLLSRAHWLQSLMLFNQSLCSRLSMGGFGQRLLNSFLDALFRLACVNCWPNDLKIRQLVLVFLHLPDIELYILLKLSQLLDIDIQLLSHLFVGDHELNIVLLVVVNN